MQTTKHEMKSEGVHVHLSGEPCKKGQLHFSAFDHNKVAMFCAYETNPRDLFEPSRIIWSLVTAEKDCLTMMAFALMEPEPSIALMNVALNYGMPSWIPREILLSGM